MAVMYMLGRTDRQFGFSDIWLEGKIRKDSYWSMMREWVFENLNDDMFQPLYSYYGRKSVSPIYSCAALLIQIEKMYSDRVMEEASMLDDRVKYAMTAPRDFEGIDAMTLCDHRKRLLQSEVGREILAKTIESSKNAGMFSEENLHVIDSFMVWGANARQDTYTMIYQGIKMVLHILGFYVMEKEALLTLERTDYCEKIRKPKIDWEVPMEKEALLDALVKDALSLIAHVKNKSNIPEDLLEAVGLLEKVATQDIKMNDGGKAEMVKGTAKDRVISINDPQMRHGRKTSSKCSDGYKAEIITGGEKASIIMTVDVYGANVPDGEHMGDLIDDVINTGNTVDKLYGDSAYSDWEEIEKREKDGMEFVIKVPQSFNPKGGYSKSDFDIDLSKGSVTCPAGNFESFDPEKITNREGCVVCFGANTCNNCPLKGECTTSKIGRTITINPFEDRIDAQRKFQMTEEYKGDYPKRSNGERTISEATKHGGRQSRFKGTIKTKWQLTMVGINNNIKATARFIHRKRQNNPQDGLCPQAT